MCGIVGIVGRNIDENDTESVRQSLKQLQKRGPDNQQFLAIPSKAILGHARLSIIDLSEEANQPMSDTTGRYTIIFNGEIYNYRELRKPLEEAGMSFKSQSDTEVVLNLYIKHGPAMLSMLNGFFGLAIYDHTENEIFIARDRYGIKPMHYSIFDSRILFSSELKAMTHLLPGKDINYNALYTYLQLNYIPAPYTIFENVQKLMPGHYLIFRGESIQKHEAYFTHASTGQHTQSDNYADAIKALKEKLEASVKRRMIADVPLGAFLSGGIDSSVIVSIAAQHTEKLKTFSIGFKDQPFYDETRFAQVVADRYKTEHHELSLSNNDMLEELDNILDYFDEPFADSSAIAVYILSKYTRGQVTVALSGDGADELLAGYNKHYAYKMSLEKSLKNGLVKGMAPVLDLIHGSRDSAVANKLRQARRYAIGLKLDPAQRYWRWCSYISGTDAAKMLEKDAVDYKSWQVQQNSWVQTIDDTEFNSMLHTDVNFILPNDMLAKVDKMSMANSLEVRVPFLDHELVEYLARLPHQYKIEGNHRKKILREAYKNELPEAIFNRGKHGFEVPLLQWFRKELKPMIENNLLSDQFIKDQGIFSLGQIQQLKKQLYSSNPGEISARIWGLIVFQHWWKKTYA